MTDRETLMAYRLREAEETFADAVKMLDANISPRSIAPLLASLIEITNMEQTPCRG